MFHLLIVSALVMSVAGSPDLFQWADITAAAADGFSSPVHRRLTVHHALQPFVRRRPSKTVRIFELSHPHVHTLSRKHENKSTLHHFKYSALGLTPDSHVELPLCTGGSHTFHLEHNNMNGPELRSEFPDVVAFHGRSVQDPSITADITFTPVGIRAQVWTTHHLCYVDPYSTGRSDVYTVYSRGDSLLDGAAPKHTSKRRSGQHQNPDFSERKLLSQQFNPMTPKAGAQQEYIFRLGLAVTPDYALWSQQHGGPHSTVITTLARAMGIWKRSMGLGMELISHNSLLYSFTPAELNYQGDPLALPELAPLMDNGDAYYKLKLPTYKTLVDVGHWFHKGSDGGEGGLGPCLTPINGATGGSNPIGDSFDVSFVAHEMGHQFSIEHTWTANQGGCSPSNFAPRTNPDTQAPMELGAGITIASYSGLCGNSNYLAGDSYPYFHVTTLSEFETFLQGNGLPANCGRRYILANRRPTVILPSFPLQTMVVPKDTAFQLQGAGTYKRTYHGRYIHTYIHDTCIHTIPSIHTYIDIHT